MKHLRIFENEAAYLAEKANIKRDWVCFDGEKVYYSSSLNWLSIKSNQESEELTTNIKEQDSIVWLNNDFVTYDNQIISQINLSVSDYTINGEEYYLFVVPNWEEKRGVNQSNSNLYYAWIDFETGNFGWSPFSEINSNCSIALIYYVKKINYLTKGTESIYNRSGNEMLSTQKNDGTPWGYNIPYTIVPGGDSMSGTLNILNSVGDEEILNNSIKGIEISASNKLTYLELPEGLLYLFGSCASLQTLKLPSTIKLIRTNGLPTNYEVIYKNQVYQSLNDAKTVLESDGIIIVNNIN